MNCLTIAESHIETVTPWTMKRESNWPPAKKSTIKKPSLIRVNALKARKFSEASFSRQHKKVYFSRSFFVKYSIKELTAAYLCHFKKHFCKLWCYLQLSSLMFYLEASRVMPMQNVLNKHLTFWLYIN